MQMNEKFNEFSREITLQNEEPLHAALTWLSVLSTSISVWACIF
jgi:hypothetical protein